ncbi:MAG: plasma-membrane proton-efflux P-type ATPase [Bacteroidales bacterium]|nr:plasma-membrane proton-efflux P-type ATPase [Bacteroidales bacterium]MCF8352009.1 plasma-membrane proton-efflux P-type ATPase [Bacteroidales bacterium]MCF8376580.1 plasma-membrane proton-efflux P-type ATPase [Bacteroidales bacterium]MCF8401165.1 plasma-membrane proton-efflux P-type ATPase [Bacteroidales bacterium]
MREKDQEQEKNQKEKSEFKELNVEEALDRLSVDPEKGLDEEEVKKRQEKYGKNALEEEEENPLMEFLSHFWGPIPWMIEVAVILSAIAGRWEDFAVIFIMLLINGGVSYWHEHKASNAIKALKEKLAPEARVVRNGKNKKIASKELVPGDIVVLRMGDIIPSDAKLLKKEQLSADESALTGESLPVNKEEGDLLFSGTTVKRGEAKAVVTATGCHTRFAKTVELVESAEEKSHFQKAVLRIGYWLIGLTAGLVALIIGTGVVRGDPLWDILLFALVLTIAGIPQALPAVLSVTMTVGANRLARKKAIVSRLASMEEMAGLEVLFSDKTGTLTKNQLELQDPVVFEAEDKKDLIMVAALTAKRGEEEEDPIDKAISDAVEDKDELHNYQIEAFRPFDPTRKRAETDVKKDDKQFTAAKGAPQVILDLVKAGEELKKKVIDKVDELGEEGYRSLGVARKKKDGKWQYLGLLPLLDPPREDSADVVKDAQNHGIDIRMVTGDHKAIGRKVAGQIGLEADIVSAGEYFGNDEQKKKDIQQIKGFAEVTPEHKFNIIKEFQANDRIVGMTGDGVNDAPALKQADVGIAVSGATDAARSASDLVLTEPGLGVITQAIEEARRIFERMISYATFRITETMRVLLFMTVSILAFNFYPVTPIMIVLLAILNDIPIMTIASDNVRTAAKPVRWNMKRVLSIASVLSVTGVISSFLLYWYLRTQANASTETIQTMIFLKLLVAGHMTIFLTRNTGALWQKPYPSLLLFLTLEGTQVIGTLFAVYGILIPPIGWANAGIVWAYAFVWIFMLSGVKILTYKILEKYTDIETTNR